MHSCQEFSGDEAVDSGIDCVYTAIYQAVRVGLATRGIYTGAQSIVNYFGGTRKRDDNSTMAGALIAMGPPALNSLQAIAPKIDNLTLLHIDHGVPELKDSVTFGFGHEEHGVRIRHVTNGTHGFTRTLRQPAPPSGPSKLQSWSWSS